MEVIIFLLLFFIAMLLRRNAKLLREIEQISYSLYETEQKLKNSEPPTINWQPSYSPVDLSKLKIQ